MIVETLGSLNPLGGGNFPNLCFPSGQLSCFDPMADLPQDTPLCVHTFQPRWILVQRLGGGGG